MKKVDNYLYTHPKTLTALTVISFLGGVSLGIYHSLKHRKKKGAYTAPLLFANFTTPNIGGDLYGKMFTF